MPIEDEAILKTILEQARTVAVVGASPKPWRDSHSVALFLKRAGYTVYYVNPSYETIEGEPCYPNLRSVPSTIDIVDVFRQPSAVPDIVQEAIAIHAKTLWLQYGVVHDEAAAEAERAGLQVVMDHCIAVDYRRLMH
jgi:predicted CoA-binding protein